MKLPLFARFIMLDALYCANRAGMAFANVFIRPLGRRRLEELRKEVAEGSIRKVLVNRSDQIGDAVVSLRMIEALVEKFGSVSVIASKKNSFVFAGTKGVRLVFEKGKPGYQRSNIIITAFYFVWKSIRALALGTKGVAPEYDLIVDLAGDFTVKERFPSRYMIGPNRGIASTQYTGFYRASFATSGVQLLESYKEMVSGLLGIEVKISDAPPEGCAKKKKNQVFVFVGNTPNRNLSPSKWKELILSASALAPCIVADDPEQRVMPELEKDKGIAGNPRIKLISGARELPELAEIANQSALFAALDGGGEHFMERYTNALVMYTCGLPSEWKPYSSNPYSVQALEKEHVLEQTVTSAGLRKLVFYRGRNRKPTYGLVCDEPAWKDFDARIFASIVERALKS